MKLLEKVEKYMRTNQLHIVAASKREDPGPVR